MLYCCETLIRSPASYEKHALKVMSQNLKLLHGQQVVRAFDDDDIIHVSGKVNSVDDVGTFS
jgi:hypothetical protein